MENTADELRGELTEMRSAMEQQQSRIAPLEAGAAAPPDRPLRSRRQMLKLAGAPVAGAAAAGIASSAVRGLAATGGNMILGGSSDAGATSPVNSADHATELQYNNPGVDPGIGFLSQIGTAFTPRECGISLRPGRVDVSASHT